MNHRLLFATLAAGLFATAASAQSGPGQYCREFTQPIRVGGVYHNAYGTSCRQPDGTWRIVQQPVAYPPERYIQPQPVEYYQPDVYAYSEPYYYPYYPYPYYAPFSFSFGYSNWHGWNDHDWHGGGGWHNSPTLGSHAGGGWHGGGGSHH